jgi:hypothetical protein
MQKNPRCIVVFSIGATGMQTCCSDVTGTARGALCAGDATDEMALRYFA